MKKIRIFRQVNPNLRTQERAAAIIGITQEYYSAIERGKYIPEWRIRRKIEEVFGESFNFLMEEVTQ